MRQWMNMNMTTKKKNLNKKTTIFRFFLFSLLYSSLDTYYVRLCYLCVDFYLLFNWTWNLLRFINTHAEFRIIQFAIDWKSIYSEFRLSKKNRFPSQRQKNVSIWKLCWLESILYSLFEKRMAKKSQFSFSTEIVSLCACEPKLKKKTRKVSVVIFIVILFVCAVKWMTIANKIIPFWKKQIGRWEKMPNDLYVQKQNKNSIKMRALSLKWDKRIK